MTDNRKRILVMCTGNSCRSQMAEGFLKQLTPGKADVYSAGIEAHGLNPRAVQVMKEIGIDISHHTSDSIDKYAGETFDFVITVCDNARERCPYFPAQTKTLHRDFPDPAKAAGSNETIMKEFRRVRDEIREYCIHFVNEHIKTSEASRSS